MELIVVIGWLVFCFLVGSSANKRGRSALGWMLLSFCCSPLMAAIVLFVLPDLAEIDARRQEVEERRAAREHEAQVRSAEREAEAARHEAERRAEAGMQSLAQRRAKERRAREAAKIMGADLVISLEQLRRLKDQAVYSDAEYSARKETLLVDLRQRVLAEPVETFLGALLPLLASGTLTHDEMQRIKRIALGEDS